MIDRFVIKGIALEMWTERYTFHNKEHGRELVCTAEIPLSDFTMIISCSAIFLCCLFLLYQCGPKTIVF